MKATMVSSQLAVFGLVVVIAACGGSPTAPSQPPRSTDPAGQTTFTILDGWSQLPVAGAAVTANGTQALTDEAGHVQFAAALSGCVVLEVKATGFLDRRTCGSSRARLSSASSSATRSAPRSADPTSASSSATFTAPPPRF